MREMEKKDEQVDEPCFSDVVGDEFGGELDSDEQEGEIARGGGAEVLLLSENMPGERRGE